MALFNPFCKCLYPQRILNPYTHEYMTVPCGHCEACVLAKNSRYAFQCDLESYACKHTVFVTLTYANNYLPIATPVPYPVDPADDYAGVFKKYSLIDFETGENLCDFEYQIDKLELLQRKFNLCGAIPYLRKYDLQLFFKRFRYYVTKRFPQEKVRYFACGEYGPIHFRPHYHLLLFFSSDEVLQICSKAVSEAWTFGRIDCQISKGKCSSYVAGYVNSSCTVPQVLKMPSVCPFSVHSQKLGQGFLQGERSKVYSLTPCEFVKRSIVLNGKYKEFDVWRSAYSYFFPKCKGFVSKSSRERSYSYGIYDTARRLFPSAETTLSLAKEIATYIHVFHGFEETYMLNVFDGPCSDMTKLYKLSDYFYDYEIEHYDLDSVDFSRYVQRIYTELLVSKHFLYFVCDRPTLSEQKRKLKLIEEFYSYLDYSNLTKFFENQQLFYESDLYGDDDLMSDNWENSYYPYFYDNIRSDCDLEVFKKSPCYSLYSSDVKKLFDDRIKHKKLNDANKIFFD